VGDGTQINIWEDNWIPGSHNMKILTPRGNNIVTRVNELINLVDSTWDTNLIRSIFGGIDVTRILQIPITPGREDCVAWHYNRNGFFSVRSAYHGQWKKKYGARIFGVLGSGTSNQQVWKQFMKFLAGGPLMACCLANKSWQIGILVLLEGAQFAIMVLKILSI